MAVDPRREKQKSQERFANLHKTLRRYWICMLPEVGTEFEDGLPNFNLFLDNFRTDAEKRKG